MPDRFVRVPVELGERSYEVTVGQGARHELEAVLPSRAKRVAVVTQSGIPVDVAPGVPSQRFVIGPGEEAKTMATVEDLCRGFARAGMTRDDVVVAVGGGVVTDVAGFAAASYLRGVGLVNIPTTLVAQVDAAIGGKTGVNIPEGKNLVGAFWQPAAVLCDTETLESLPGRERVSGLGEIAKYVLTRAEGVPALLEEGQAGDAPIEDLVARSVALKSAIVARDEREGGIRALLNYGHTLGHALEAAALSRRDDLPHGEAVAVGLVFAARLARRLGRVGDETVQHHRRVVAGYGLPTALPPGTVADELLGYMGRDKKAQSGLTFVLDGPAGLEVVAGVAERDVVLTLEEMKLEEMERRDG